MSVRAGADSRRSLSDAQVELAAAQLEEAERLRVAIAPLSDSFSGITVDDAYRIQVLNAERRLEHGAKLKGHKVGLTAKAMQDLFGVFEPDYGQLFDDMFVLENQPVPVERFIAPRVEIESAFILSRRLEGPGMTTGDAIRAIEWVLPSIEIIDSRIDSWRIRLADTVADNGSSAAVVLGGHPMRLPDLDLRDLSAEMLIDGHTVEEGNTSAVLGNPINALVWLANTLGAAGVALEEGHVVLPGTCVRAVPVSKGTTVTGRFRSLGDVSVEFV